MTSLTSSVHSMTMIPYVPQPTAEEFIRQEVQRINNQEQQKGSERTLTYSPVSSFFTTEDLVNNTCAFLHLKEIASLSCTHRDTRQALSIHLQQLRFANLYCCFQFTDASLQALAQSCPQLTSIMLAGCRQITDTGLQALAKHCPQLTFVNLLNCRQITDVGVTALAQGCPHLTTLSLRGCDQITDVGTTALAQGCPRLKS